MAVEMTDGTLKGQIKPILSDGMPTGTVLPFAGSTTPNGYLLCDGSAVSRSTYANLFKVIGTTYGAGDGSSTFNLPNLVDRFVEGGSASGAVKDAGLPNINGTLKGNAEFRESYGTVIRQHDTRDVTRRYLAPNGEYDTTEGRNDSTILPTYCYVSLNANALNNIYGASSTVQPPAIVMKYIIKI